MQILPLKNGICRIEGVFAGGVNAGLKSEGLDLGFIFFQKPAEVVYLLTTNRFKAAPLRYLEKKQITSTNLVIVNSKNANAMTGNRGIADLEEILKEATGELKRQIGVDGICPIMSSTGVIGVPLPIEKLKEGVKKINFRDRRSENFARAIMTTDSFPKEIALEITDEVGTFRIAGVAKGAGMIAPGMATMLAFIVTDITLPRNKLKEILEEVTEITFNSISVDGDRSTNDSVFLFSTATQQGTEESFRKGLEQVMLKLALDIVRDGEGATKVVRFKVTGAKNREEGKRVASQLANSLLVKTALFGEDPNWGRIGATVGASGVECDEEKITIKIGGVTLYQQGKILMDAEREKKAHQAMKQDSFTVEVDLGIGNGEWTYYGCDLSYDYVKINALYRT